MFGKIIIALYTWYSKKVQAKYKKVQKDTNKEKEVEFYKNLQGLYKFAQWLNKQFPNRKERKKFWGAVSRGEKPLENVMTNMIANYNNKEKVKVKRAENKKHGQEKTI